MPISITQVTSTKSLWLLGLLALTILFYFNVKSHNIEPHDHEYVLSSIAELRNQITIVDKTVYETRVGIKQNFDPLTNHLRTLTALNTTIQKTLPSEINNVLQTEMEQFNQSLISKQENLEGFKSYFAVLRNSIAYLPLAAEDYLNEAANYELTTNEAHLVNTLVHTVLSYTLTSSSNDLNKINELLENIADSHSGSAIRTELIEPLVAHTNLIVRYKQNIDNLLSNDEASPEHVAISQLHSSYTSFYEKRENEARIYRYLLVIFAALLACSVIIALFYLSKTTDRLRASLKDLNFQKYALDQHAIVSITDQNGLITYANEKFCQISGYKLEELLGNSHRLVRSDAHSKEFFSVLWDTITSGKVWQGEIKNHSKDGQIYWVRSTIVPFLDDNGIPFKFVSIRTDVTQQKQAEAEIFQAMEQAKQASGAKSRFLAIITHELRTPLNAILGMLHLLSESSLTPNQKKQLMTANNSGELLLTIINDVLDFSKMEAGKLEVETIPFVPATIVEESATSLSESAYNKGLEFVCDISQLPYCSVEGDPTRIRQVLGNLISNAIKFTEKGVVVVNAQLTDDAIIYSVSDTGIGLSEDKLKTIFKPFEQADSATTRNYGGTGLGLSICLRLAEAMGGELTVQSTQDHGATFTLTIPTKSLTPAQLLPDHQDYFAKLNILMVSHCQRNLIMLDQTLRNWGVMHCFHTTDSRAALEMLRSNNNTVSLLIIDMDMPNGAGGNLSQMIELDSQINCRQLFLSGLSIDSSFTTHGAWLSKPLIQSELYNAIIIQDEMLHIGASPRHHGKQQYNFANFRILLAEDNLVNQQVAEALLEKTGVTLDMVDNGLKCLHAVQQKDYDLVLMDIQMPEMDGYTATQRIRALGGRFQQLPIIATTANAFSSNRQESINIGMNAHITKPLNPKVLYETIAEWLPSKPSQQTPKALEKETEIERGNTNSPPHISAIDINATMERLQLSWEVYSNILQTFARSYTNFCDELKEALKQSDLQTGIKLAHTLKGSSSNLGAHEIALLAKKIEQACKDEKPQEAIETQAILDPQLTQLLKDIETLKSNE